MKNVLSLLNTSAQKEPCVEQSENLHSSQPIPKKSITSDNNDFIERMRSALSTSNHESPTKGQNAV